MEKGALDTILIILKIMNIGKVSLTMFLSKIVYAIVKEVLLCALMSPHGKRYVVEYRVTLTCLKKVENHSMRIHLQKRVPEKCN